MKKIHIALLILIAATIAVLNQFYGNIEYLRLSPVGHEKEGENGKHYRQA